ncbi:Iron-sulfur cluster co-chaperone protein HscB, mitochondrial [Folsomia candida]|uniref:Iron-sulfur cluster co-chaperone protein HscB, mitochondrial n=2 Tax=Folsomia candida TaxID=158441 RepID=A0A226EN49_FOLCA|nr:Iron-sulfur cluster co-chaperone protein HscB, mitochondrial [Folsomia candida]
MLKTYAKNNPTPCHQQIIRSFSRSISSPKERKTQPHKGHVITSVPSCLTLPMSQVIMISKCFSGKPVENGVHCWKCKQKLESGSELDYLLCSGCGSPQRVVVGGDGDTRRGVWRPSFYELLGVKEQSFAVDVDELAATVRRLQKKLHPDLFAGKGKEEEEASQELSSLINKAFSTLASPIDRGRYLLQLRGVKDPLGDIEKEITSEPTFLEEVMTLNERLEELESEKDWRHFREENDKVLTQLQSDLNVAFTENKIDEAKIILARMKYFDTLQSKLKELKSKLNIVE